MNFFKFLFCMQFVFVDFLRSDRVVHRHVANFLW